MFSQLLQGLSRHLPSQCAVCRSWPSQPLCEECVTEFAQPTPRCATCALPVLQNMAQCGACIAQPPLFDQCLAAVPYDYPWSQLVVDFKFGGQAAWASSFATLMRSAPWVEPALDQADLVLPMPLSGKRLKERGFNQTLLLARALDHSKVRHDLLLRIKDTPAQSSLPREERLRSVENAYVLEPLQAELVRDKRIVLIDDVMTTGATLNAAARVLHQAGAAHITAVVFARTE
jgi:ComF family protein